MKLIRLIIERIENTRTKNGLTISADIGKGIYEKGKVVTDEELEKVNLIGMNSTETGTIQ
jgi:hypothetical protein